MPNNNGRTGLYVAVVVLGLWQCAVNAQTTYPVIGNAGTGSVQTQVIATRTNDNGTSGLSYRSIPIPTVQDLLEGSGMDLVINGRTVTFNNAMANHIRTVANDPLYVTTATAGYTDIGTTAGHWQLADKLRWNDTSTATSTTQALMYLDPATSRVAIRLNSQIAGNKLDAGLNIGPRGAEPFISCYGNANGNTNDAALFQVEANGDIGTEGGLVVGGDIFGSGFSEFLGDFYTHGDFTADGNAQAATFIGSGAPLTNLNGSNVATGTVGVPVGGTGFNSYTANDMIYASGATTLAKLGINATATRKFIRSVSSGAPAWDALLGEDIAGGTVANVRLSGSAQAAITASHAQNTDTGTDAATWTAGGNVVVGTNLTVGEASSTFGSNVGLGGQTVGIAFGDGGVSANLTIGDGAGTPIMDWSGPFNAQSNLSTGGTLTVASGTPITGHLSATAALNFGLLASLTTSELSITVTGAVAGDSVTVTPTGSPESGLMWAGRADTDVVYVRISDISIAGIDPASRTWRADVWKH